MTKLEQVELAIRRAESTYGIFPPTKDVLHRLAEALTPGRKAETATKADSGDVVAELGLAIRTILQE